MGAGGYRCYPDMHAFKINVIMLRRLTIIFLIAAASLQTLAQTETRFGNEASDTTFIGDLLTEASQQKFDTPENRVAFFARKFIGTPYGAHTLEGEPEILTVRVDSLDCTTFVETAMALAMTIGEGRSSWRDFVYNLQRMRYRNGQVNGYPSRLHYICDWAVDNTHRGNIKDATMLFPGANYLQRTIDFMTTNRDKYPALADDDNYHRIRDLENGYRRHKFPYIKSSALGAKVTKNVFHEGDVVALVTKLNNLDVTHMGIIVLEDGEPYLLHASSTDGKVEISKHNLAEFMRRNRQWLGIRVFRLSE